MQNARKRLLRSVMTGAAFVAPVLSHATCWEAASNAYGIPSTLLKAVARTESGFNPKAKNRNPNGTFDIGLMQINSAWLPTLEQYGVNEAALQDPCINLKVGAWILANNAKKLGWNWSAIGAYNVGCARLDSTECDRRRSQYAWKIHAALTQVTASEGGAKDESILSYEQAATSVSQGTFRADQVVAPKKIMIVQVASAGQMERPAVAGQDGEDRSLSIGGFLNYEDATDE